jgi:hypothetical protein
MVQGWFEGGLPRKDVAEELNPQESASFPCVPNALGTGFLQKVPVEVVGNLPIEILLKLQPDRVVWERRKAFGAHVIPVEKLVVNF